MSKPRVGSLGLCTGLVAAAVGQLGHHGDVTTGTDWGPSSVIQHGLGRPKIMGKSGGKNHGEFVGHILKQRRSFFAGTIISKSEIVQCYV